MCIPFEQSYLLHFWSTLSEINPVIKSEEAETSQKSSEVFTKSITQSPSHFIEDLQVLEERGFFEALNFLDEIQVSNSPWNSANHTYAKSNFEENQNTTCLLSDAESVQIAMINPLPNLQEDKQAKTAIKRNSIMSDDNLVISHSTDHPKQIENNHEENQNGTCLLSDTESINS